MEQMKTPPQRKLSKAQLYGKLIQSHYGELLFGCFHLPGFWESVARCVCVPSYVVRYMLHASHTKRHLLKEYCEMTPLKYEVWGWTNYLHPWCGKKIKSCGGHPTQTSDNRKQFNVKIHPSQRKAVKTPSESHHLPQDKTRYRRGMGGHHLLKWIHTGRSTANALWAVIWSSGRFNSLQHWLVV